MISRVMNGHYYELDVIIMLLYLPTLSDFNSIRGEGALDGNVASINE